MADNNGNAKLEWMYKTGKEMINREDYLTGKKVDKHFEEMTTGENCVEHDVLPASVSRKNALESQDQVDIIRKQMEDPLMAIKQKEMEARRKILENPVKLKELHRLLKIEKQEKVSSRFKRFHFQYNLNCAFFRVEINLHLKSRKSQRRNTRNRDPARPHLRVILKTLTSFS